MNQKEKLFVKTVWDYYLHHGRRNLPWRGTKNPYRVLVSEMMLQQTQVERVVPKYRSFLETFPTLQSLAEVSLGEVLRGWQGLGYNRRAKMLHQCAVKLMQDHNGRFPVTQVSLEKLPGVGPYTAGAILAFAHNKPVVMIETNIRTVFLYHFYGATQSVADTTLLKIVEKTLDTENSREWYWALMDYGTHLKKEHGNLNRASRHYVKQSPFKGSDRQIRGAILRTLVQSSCVKQKLIDELRQFSQFRIDRQLNRLESEGMVVLKKGRYQLPS